MKKTRFTETQIVSTLKRQEVGITPKEIYRELGISEATSYNWKSKYRGMEASEVKRFKDPEEENTRFKKNVCRPGYGQSDSERPVHKKSLGPTTKWKLTEEIVLEQGVPLSRACSSFVFNKKRSYLCQ